MDFSAIAQKYGGKLTGTTTPPTAKNGTSNFASIAAKYGGELTTAAGSKSQSDNTRTTNPLGKALTAFGNAAKDTTNALTGNSGTALDYVNPVGWASKLFGGAVNAVGSGVSALADVTTKPLATAIGGGLRNLIGGQNVDKGIKDVANLPVLPVGKLTIGNAAKDIANTVSQPDTQAALGAVGNVANLAGTVVGIGQGVESLGDVSEAVAKSKALQQKFIDSSKADWNKPTTIPSASFSKATDIARNSSGDVADTLVKNKIKLSDNVDSGKYATADTADQIRADAGKASAELLRPALQQADLSTPMTAVSDVINTTIQDIENSKGVTPDDMEAQKQKAISKGESLARKYPNGMGLADMHDTKIDYSLNGKYSPVGDTTVNNNAGVNRAFGRTLASMVEQKAPSDVPVHQFNAELQKQYEAADYLDALNTKKVPVSVASMIAKTSAKVVGAAVGDTLGGGILGGVGGYHIGGMVESMLENMPNPIKGYFLDNLQTTNPEAFDAIRKYMGDEKVAASQRKMLPPPNESRPILMGQGTQIDPQSTNNNYSTQQQLQLPAGSSATENNISPTPIIPSPNAGPQNPLNPTRFPWGG